jgi:lipopolysaccharide transport system permease protein
MRNLKNFSASPTELFQSLRVNHHLIKALTKREVYGRYQGSLIGILWTLINPLLMLLVYSFVFGLVFKARWNNGAESMVEFSLVLFSGLMVFNFFAECIGRAPTTILNNANLVKRVVFPLELLSVITLCSAGFHFLVSFFVWLLAYALIIGIPNASIILAPLALIPLLLITIGLSWILAALGVYFRDVQHLIGPIITALMFMSPIFYSIDSLPENYRCLFQLNPLAESIEIFRGLVYFGKFPNITDLAIYFLFSLLIAFLGFTFFQKTRKGFADVL